MLSGRRKLLVADDSQATRKVIEMFFGEEGYEVVAVGNGAEALRELDAEPPPDVLLADAVMQVGPSGYELCDRVKRDARLRDVPVVLLVSRYEPFNEAEARRVGADTVLTKPFQSIRDLVSKVGSLLGGESKHADEQRHDASSHGLDERADVQAQPNDEAAHAEARVEEHSHASDAARDFGADAASPYADLGADDELIEARPAEAFDAGGVFSEPEPEPFAARESHTSEEFSTGERFGAREYEHAAAKNGHSTAAHAAPSSSFMSPSNYAEENPMPAQPSFESRAASAAAADDTLLDLGQLEPNYGAASTVAAEDDDFILDLDDEPLSALGAPGNFGDTPGLNESYSETPQPDAPSAFAEASHGEHAASVSEPSELFSEPSEPSNESAELFSEPAVPFAASAHSFSEDASASMSSENESTFDAGVVEHPTFEHTESSFDDTAHASSESAGATASEFVMQDGPQGFASYVAPQGVGAAPRGFVEPEVVPSDVPVPTAAEAEFTDGSVEGDLPKAPAAVSQTSASHGEPSTEGYAVVEGHTRVEEPVSASQLSQEAIDAIARRVVEMMSDKVVREIAWEVVPELAELLIKQKLEEDGKK